MAVGLMGEVRAAVRAVAVRATAVAAMVAGMGRVAQAVANMVEVCAEALATVEVPMAAAKAGWATAVGTAVATATVAMVATLAVAEREAVVAASGVRKVASVGTLEVVAMVLGWRVTVAAALAAGALVETVEARVGAVLGAVPQVPAVAAEMAVGAWEEVQPAVAVLVAVGLVAEGLAVVN